MASVTPLLRFLRAMDPNERSAFASAVGTTPIYLYQLAAKEDPNPRLRLALAIVEQSALLAGPLKTEPLTLEDLLVGAKPDKE